jgi:hypothetical protein
MILNDAIATVMIYVIFFEIAICTVIMNDIPKAISMAGNIIDILVSIIAINF